MNLEQSKFAMVSEWMEHGTISEFVGKHKDISRVQLVRRLCVTPYGDQPD